MNIRFLGFGAIESLAALVFLGTTTGASPPSSTLMKSEAVFSPERLYIVPQCLVVLSGRVGVRLG